MPATRYLDPTEREKLLGVLPHPRDRLLVVLGLNTGFRISELLSLRWGQLIKDGEPRTEVEITRARLKGGRSQHRRRVRTRRLPLNAAAVAAILEYMFNLGGAGKLDPQGWVFRSRKCFPGVISRRHARDVLAAASERAGLAESVAPHALRRSFAEDAYRLSGCDILAVRDLLGHSSVLTTEQYLRPRASALHALVRRLGEPPTEAAPPLAVTLSHGNAR